MSKNNEHNNSTTIQNISSPNNDTLVELSGYIRVLGKIALGILFVSIISMFILARLLIFKFEHVVKLPSDLLEYINEYETIYIDERSGDENTSFEVETSENCGMLTVYEDCYFTMEDNSCSPDFWDNVSGRDL